MPQCLGQIRVVLDEGGAGRSPGQGLEAQRAAAGEQVQAPTAGQMERQPVEQGFPGTGRGRADAAGIGKTQLATAPVAANDAEFSRRTLVAALGRGLTFSTPVWSGSDC